jgi:hypothetical protein
VRSAGDVVVEDLAVAFAQGEALGEEEIVEQAALGGLGDLLEARERDLAAGLRMLPQGVFVDSADVVPWCS